MVSMQHMKHMFVNERLMAEGQFLCNYLLARVKDSVVDNTEQLLLAVSAIYKQVQQTNTNTQTTFQTYQYL